MAVLLFYIENKLRQTGVFFLFGNPLYNATTQTTGPFVLKQFEIVQQ